jgi:allophanate hydrolase
MSTIMSTVERVRAAYAAIDAADRPEVWITLRTEHEVLAEARAIDARVAVGGQLPLAGLTAAVKDNIDVAGLPTTAGAASYSYLPERDATSVARLRAAGAVIIGKANMDQFATGLVGTRSPYGAVRNAVDPSLISGGSSSGSAVAVALGFADIALGTDTAGSGRVPAALNGVVGVKPTRGLVPATGVVPACRSLDCVTVFARSLPLARRTVTLISGPDGRDPLARQQQHGAAGCHDGQFRIAVPLPAQLGGMDDGWADAFSAAAARLRASGAETVPVDISPLLEASLLLYGGAFVAERYAAVGAHIDAHAALIGSDLDPTVARIILDGAGHTAAGYFADRERLDFLTARAAKSLSGFDALLTPTTTGHPSLSAVAADPVGVNARLGRFTNFANLLDMAAVAVPGGTVRGLPFGIMLTGPAFSDGLLTRIAESYEQAPVDLLVVGAHLSGQPLNHELLAAGGVFVSAAATAESYRLFALGTVPAKPGLVRTGELGACGERGMAADGAGASIGGEIWRLPATGFAQFMARLAVPMTIGVVRLSDGQDVLGFLCESAALPGARDITGYGGWRAWQERG